MCFISDLLRVWYESLVHRRIVFASDVVFLRWCRVFRPSGALELPAPSELDVRLLGSLFLRWYGRRGLISERRNPPARCPVRCVAQGLYALSDDMILNGLELIVFRPSIGRDLFVCMAHAGIRDVILFSAVRSVLGIEPMHRRAGVEYVGFDRHARVLNTPAFWLSLVCVLWPGARLLDYAFWACQQRRVDGHVWRLLEGQRRIFAVAPPFVIAEGRRRLCVTVRNSTWQADCGTVVLISYIERRDWV